MTTPACSCCYSIELPTTSIKGLNSSYHDRGLTRRFEKHCRRQRAVA